MYLLYPDLEKESRPHAAEGPWRIVLDCNCRLDILVKQGWWNLKFDRWQTHARFHVARTSWETKLIDR